MNKRLAAGGAALAVLAAVAYALTRSDGSGDAGVGRRVAVETAPPARGTLVDRRNFPGSLEPAAQFTVAPKVAGRVDTIPVDIGDRVARGDVVTRLDDAEFQQEVKQAEAELAVARARLREARSAHELSERRLERVRRLREQGIAPASELDEVETEAGARAAAAAVAEAQVAQARAALERAQVRLGYTRITADWPDGDAERVVGERLVDAGDTVAANTPLLTIVATRELKAVIQVPQSVYGPLAVGQRARVIAPSLPGEGFEAVVARIAPRFDPASRQARVELAVANPEHVLAPGMFVQVALETERMDAAVIVPESALVERGGETGIFTVAPGAGTARFVPARAALSTGGRVALAGIGAVEGEVVVLGQDQLTDGAAVVRADRAAGS